VRPVVRFHSTLLFMAFTWMASELLAAKVEGTGDYVMPSWFKNSFLDLKDDINEASSAGKRVMIYFHQRGCPYCAELINNNFSQKHIVDYARKHFDVIEINMWGDRDVTGVDGKTLSEKNFAASQKVWFTPTIVFYDESGNIALRVNGYYPPDQFLAALKFVAEKREKKQSFRDYYIGKKSHKGQALISEPFFIKPPHDLQKLASAKPLAVFFEQKDCPACTTLHQKIFSRQGTREQLDKYNVVQLDMWSKEPIVTPEGDKMTAREYANKLGIMYAPSAVFYDEGKEVIRIEAFLKAFHVQSIMDYASSGAYKTEPSLQRFIQKRADHLLEEGKKVDLWQ
jgi:thioredoxin-related protein